ncbi:MAG: hypothetical protein RL769_499 [Pseudomonadota bacterium]|jgi:biopolymer transport protein ExbD
MTNDFQREELQAPLAEINMTPLVDIMLVLLVILLISAPIIHSAINVNLPKESAQNIDNNKIVKITVNAQGDFFLEETQMSVSEIKKHLLAIAKDNPDQKIHLFIDQQSRYNSVSQLLAILQNQGLNNIAFITEN